MHCFLRMVSLASFSLCVVPRAPTISITYHFYGSRTSHITSHARQTSRSSCPATTAMRREAASTTTGADHGITYYNAADSSGTATGTDHGVGTGATWEIHVEFNNGMWWAMPHDLSDGILNQWLNGAQQVSFVWNWEETRRGSYRPDGAETSVNRYIIDFDIMQQRNIDNGRTRKVQVVGVLR